MSARSVAGIGTDSGNIMAQHLEDYRPLYPRKDDRTWIIAVILFILAIGITTCQEVHAQNFEGVRATTSATNAILTLYDQGGTRVVCYHGTLAKNGDKIILLVGKVEEIKNIEECDGEGFGYTTHYVDKEANEYLLAEALRKSDFTFGIAVYDVQNSEGTRRPITTVVFKHD